MTNNSIQQIRKIVAPTLILFWTFFQYLPIPKSVIPQLVEPVTGLKLLHGIAGILVVGGGILVVTYLISLAGLTGQRRYPAIYIVTLTLFMVLVAAMQWNPGRWFEAVFTSLGLLLAVASWRAGRKNPE